MDQLTNSNINKFLYIKTYGCQMNVYDSWKIVDMLKLRGYALTDKPDNADIAIINTCHIREKAEEKLYADLGRLRVAKRNNNASGKPMCIVVAGCVGQAHGSTVTKRAPYVDIVVGPQTLHRLPQLIDLVTRYYDNSSAEVLNSLVGAHLIDTDFPLESKFDELPRSTSESGVQAYVTVQEGCDKWCTFCCVPYTRGAEFSRPVADVITETQHLVATGAREITLLGQNVNAYHGLDANGQALSLGGLIFKLAEIPGLYRIRYMTSHPRDMHPELLEAHRDVKQLMPFLHLPVQSGSDKILKLMNRQHTAADYLKIIDEIRKFQPAMALSSDFIVGFCGEEEADFQQSIALAQQVFYAQAFSFKYSPRPGTAGALMKNHVEEEVKDRRLQELQQVLTQQQLEFNHNQVGKTLSVLIDRTKQDAETHTNSPNVTQLAGRTPYNQLVYTEGPASLIGQEILVKVTGSSRNSLTGEIVSPDNATAA